MLSRWKYRLIKKLLPYMPSRHPGDRIAGAVQFDDGSIMADPWWGISIDLNSVNMELAFDEEQEFISGELGRVDKPDGTSEIVKGPKQERPDSLSAGAFFRPIGSMSVCVIRQPQVTDEDKDAWNQMIQGAILDTGHFYFLLVNDPPPSAYGA